MLCLRVAQAVVLALLELAIIAQTATSTVALNTAAKAAGKLYFGSATDTPELPDSAYLAILSDTAMFGQLTPGNSMKWDSIEPEQNVFNFTGGDQIVALAETTGKLMRGHNLVWHSQLPDWVMYGTWTPQTLTSVIRTHVWTEVSHYRGKIFYFIASESSVVTLSQDAWDVVNEPLNDNGTMRADVFYDILNSSYINLALQTAHAADPYAKLYINDYNLEYASPKIDAMVQLVEDLLVAGAPIHGIGFEGHFILGEVSGTQLQTNMERITALGLEVAITELDVRIQLPATDADLKQQKADYMTVVQACMAVPGCVGVTLWDYTDRHSWIPSTFPGQGEACPWNANLLRKPAYDGIAMGFNAP
ncbi:glycoside hydrolase family 10 protein [Paxillus rubicundulus Ve08.2h10]|uniref:Beta-xylanase n=1 Tax=Paxillus rubicundulus Ve08.2h10 TaxID=930991 RepID=A0A0D0DD62_9AGAM|nr:glycoside hydrolase family 10 protein [Paxillus rubicundulus Ve08.2h10]